LKVCKPLLVEGKRIGVLLPNVIEELKKHPDVFEIQSSEDGNVISVQLHKDLKTYDARTEAVGKVVNEWRKNDVFCALRGWRNEVRRFPQIQYIYIVMCYIEFIGDSLP
jgi:hypothetical protein